MNKIRQLWKAAGMAQGTLSVHGLVLVDRGWGVGCRQVAFRRQLLELGRGFFIPSLARDLPAEAGMRAQAFGKLGR